MRVVDTQSWLIRTELGDICVSQTICDPSIQANYTLKEICEPHLVLSWKRTTKVLMKRMTVNPEIICRTVNPEIILDSTGIDPEQKTMVQPHLSS